MKGRPRGTGCLFRYEHSRFWWMKYYIGKKMCYESTKTGKKREAENILAQRLAEVRTGQFFGPEWERALVDDLIADLINNYRLKGRRSLGDVSARWRKHLRPIFGAMRASEVTTGLIEHYVEKRLEAGARPATVNREVAILRRMYSLALTTTPPKVNPNRVPRFVTLKEGRPRTGFVTREDFSKLRDAYPDLWWKVLLTVSYTYGWRKGELLSLQVSEVDLADGTLRLNPGTTKNDEGRTVKLTKELRRILRSLIQGKDGTDYVFTRSDGHRVRDFRERWKIACRKAGLGNYVVKHKEGKRTKNYKGLVFHDLRRSAVRNLIRAGVPEVVAMSITGHKTRAVFDRYNIVSEADLAEAAKRLERHNG